MKTNHICPRCGLEHLKTESCPTNSRWREFVLAFAFCFWGRDSRRGSVQSDGMRWAADAKYEKRLFLKVYLIATAIIVPIIIVILVLSSL